MGRLRRMVRTSLKMFKGLSKILEKPGKISPRIIMPGAFPVSINLRINSGTGCTSG